MLILFVDADACPVKDEIYRVANRHSLEVIVVAVGIGDALISRDLSSELREMGLMKGGPAPFQKKDRSLFLQQLDAAIHLIRRRAKL